MYNRQKALQVPFVLSGPGQAAHALPIPDGAIPAPDFSVGQSGID